MGSVPLVAPVSGHGGHRRRAGVLDGGRRRRHLRLRRRPLLRLGGRPGAQRPGGGRSPPATTAPATCWCRPTAASSASARFRFYGSLGGGYGGDPSNVPPVAGITLTPDGTGLLAPRAGRLVVRLLEPGGQPGPPASPPPSCPSPTARWAPTRTRVVLQPLRPLRGVVRPLRHLGVAAGRGPHPVLRRSPATSSTGRPARTAVLPSDGAPRARRRRALRDRTVVAPPPRSTWAW